MTVKLSIGLIQSNSKLVSAKHWTYQTLKGRLHDRKIWYGPITFVKKHWSFYRAIGAYGPVETPVFLYKSYGSVPLFGRVRTQIFLSCKRPLSECIHACVMTLPIEEYKLLNQAYLARRRCCKILRRFFLLQEKGIAVKLSMGKIKSNLKLPLRANIRRVLL